MSQRNEQPAYRRIADDLRARIQAGDPPPGGMLGSDAVLVRTYGVARGTVRQAVAELERLGLVVSEMGKGRRVVGAASGEPGPPSTRYEAVAVALRHDISSGKLPQGSQLPPESTLAEQHGVSKGTARQALQLLAAEGHITAVHGKGWFVGDAQGAMTRTDEVANSIRKAILSRDFPEESRIPGESTLAKQYGVARVTVRRAIALLEAEGIITSRRGVGRIVTPPHNQR
ncbi:GntR family transcriptional regulator [Sphaerisporangium sp. NPDC004334]